MTVSEWISLTSGCGAMGAALAAFFTLFELSKQRKSSFKPDLCIVDNTFELEESRYDGIALAIGWASQNGTQYSHCMNPGFRVVNIGLGAAKDIEVVWEYDFKNQILKINKMAEELSIANFIKEEPNSISIEVNGSSTYSVHGEDKFNNLVYLVTSNSDPKGRELPFPYRYQLIVTAYLALCSKLNLDLVEIEVPSIDLNLKFVDIGKGVHKSSHKFSCNIILKSTDSKKLSTYTMRYLEDS